MTATRSSNIIRPDEALVRAGSTVSARTFVAMGAAMNGLLGSGAMLVPFHCPGTTTITAATTFYFRCEPRTQALARMWVVQMRTPTTSSGFDMTLSAGSSLQVFSVPWTRDETTSVMLREDLSAQSNTEQTISITATPGGSSPAIQILSLGCWEVPRHSLQEDSTDVGCNIESLGHRQPIYSGVAAKSFQAIDDAVYAGRYALRRHFINHSFGDIDARAVAITGTSYTRILDYDLPCLQRKHFYADAVRAMSYKIRCRHTGGAVSVDLRVTMTNGDTTTSTFTPGTSYGWYPTTAAQVDVDAEDLTVATGLPGSTWDVATIEARLGSASGTLYVSSVSAWEAVTSC